VLLIYTAILSTREQQSSDLWEYYYLIHIVRVCGVIYIVDESIIFSNVVNHSHCVIIHPWISAIIERTRLCGGTHLTWRKIALESRVSILLSDGELDDPLGSH